MRGSERARGSGSKRGGTGGGGGGKEPARLRKAAGPTGDRTPAERDSGREGGRAGERDREGGREGGRKREGGEAGKSSGSIYGLGDALADDVNAMPFTALLTAQIAAR